MLPLSVQTKNVVYDTYPEEGFVMLAQAGFSCADFSLNDYLKNTNIYQSELNMFFDRSVQELEAFFAPHKKGAQAAGIQIQQMHMPYPVYVPTGSRELNDYLWQEVGPKSMALCAYLECPYIVIHGFKLARFLGSEEKEWAQTEKFIDSIAPYAKETGITICIENLYDGVGGHLVEGPCCDAEKAAERIDRINEKYRAEVLGFCFDTGTDLQISCKVLMVIFSYLIFLYLLWDNEIITYCQTHSAKQILTISLILIVVILIASCLLTLGTTNTEYNL